MNTGKPSVLVSIVMLVGLTLLPCTGCKTEQTKSQTKQGQYPPPPPIPIAPAYTTNQIGFLMHGVVVKVDDQLGVIVFQGDPGPTRPGLIVTCREQLPVGTPVELSLGNHWILDGDRPGRGQNCLHVEISRRDSNRVTQTETPVPFRAKMFEETIFRGNGTIIASDKKLGLVAVQDNSAGRPDLPAIFIDAFPALETNDPVTCSIKQVSLTANKLPGAPSFFGFRVTIEKSPGKLSGERVATNPQPR